MDTRHSNLEGMEAWLPPAEPRHAEKMGQLDRALIEHQDWSILQISRFVGVAWGTAKNHRQDLAAQGAIAIPVKLKTKAGHGWSRREADPTGLDLMVIPRIDVQPDAEEAMRALVPVQGSARRSRPELKYLSNCGSASRDCATVVIRTIANAAGCDEESFPWEDMTALRFQWILGFLKATVRKTSTALNYLGAVMGILEWAAADGAETGLAPEEWTKIQLVKKLTNWEAQEIDGGRLLSTDEWVRLIDSIEFGGSPEVAAGGLQTLATIGLLPLTGARVSIIAMMHPDGWTDAPSLKVMVTKTRRSNPYKSEIMFDDFPNLERALKAWWGCRPDPDGPAWYHLDNLSEVPKVAWGRPVIPDPDAIRAAAEMLGQRVTQAGKRIGLKNFSSKCGRVFFVNAAIGAGVDKTFRDAQRCVKIGGESSEGSYVRLPAKIRAHRFGNVPEFAEIDAAIGRALERHALWSGIPISRTAEASQSVDDTNTGDGIRVMTRCANPRCQRGPMGRPAIFRKSRLNQEFCSGACRSMVSKDKARAK